MIVLVGYAHEIIEIHLIEMIWSGNILFFHYYLRYFRNAVNSKIEAFLRNFTFRMSQQMPSAVIFLQEVWMEC